MRRGAPGIVFLVLGIVFLAVGMTSPAMDAVAIAFMVLGIIFLVRSRSGRE